MEKAAALVAQADTALKDTALPPTERISIAIRLLQRAAANYTLVRAFRDAAETHQLAARHALAIDAPCTSAKEHADAGVAFSRTTTHRLQALDEWAEASRLYEAQQRWASAASQQIRIIELCVSEKRLPQAIEACERAATLYDLDRCHGTAAQQRERAAWLCLDAGELAQARAYFKRALKVYATQGDMGDKTSQLAHQISLCSSNSTTSKI